MTLDVMELKVQPGANKMQIVKQLTSILKRPKTAFSLLKNQKLLDYIYSERREEALDAEGVLAEDQEARDMNELFFEEDQDDDDDWVDENEERHEYGFPELAKNGS